MKKWNPEILGVLLLALAAGAASLLGQCKLGEVLYWSESDNTWFDADNARIFNIMVDDLSPQIRSEYHPLFTLLTYPLVWLGRNALGISAITGVRILLASAASLWVAALYGLLRLLGCRRLDSTLFTLLGAVSASSVFFFSAIETFPFGSLTIVAGICMAALALKSSRSEAWLTGASAITFTMTNTNWLIGVIGAFVVARWRRAVQVTVNGFFVVAALCALQSLIFPKTFYFLPLPRGGDMSALKYSSTLLQTWMAFFFHSVVMPRFDLLDLDGWRSGLPMMIVQLSTPGSASAVGRFGVLLWSMILALGTVGLLKPSGNRRLKAIVGLSLLWQLILHSKFGFETFLYSMHWLPLLICVAALGTETRARRAILVLCALLIPLAAINNSLQFAKAVQVAGGPKIEASAFKPSSPPRPGVPWPRELPPIRMPQEPTHPDDPVAFHQLGAGFSPAPDSFGLSFWVTNRKGGLVATSEDLDPAKIEQRASPSSSDSPILRTRTPFYMATWASPSRAIWTLDLKTVEGADVSLSVVVRGPGPSGGPVWSVLQKRKGGPIVINNRWHLLFFPKAQSVRMGDETGQGGLKGGQAILKQRHDSGWAFVAVEVPKAVRICVIDTLYRAPFTASAPYYPSDCQVEVPQ